MRKTWDKEEIELLYLWHKEGWTAHEIAANIERTYKSVALKAHRLGLLFRNDYWSTEDITKLRELVSKGLKSQAQIGKILNRTEGAINRRVGLLGLANKHKKLTHKEYLDQIKDNERVICLEPYIGGHIKILHECKSCAYKWTITPAHIKSGKGCPKCSGKGTYQYYTDKAWENIPYMYLYVIILSYDNEQFVKIGITNNIKRRYTEYGQYKVNQTILEVKYTKSKQAYLDEQRLHKLYKEYKYTPKYKFNGHTECFSFLGENMNE